MSAKTLPKGFEELAQFVPQWVHGTEKARNAFRVNQSQERLQAFYDSVLPRLEDIANSLSSHSLDALSREAGNLLELALMCMEVAPAIEYYGNPDVPNSVEYQRFEIFPITPTYRVIED